MEKENIFNFEKTKAGCYRRVSDLSSLSEPDLSSIHTSVNTTEDESVPPQQPNFINKIHWGFTKLNKKCQLFKRSFSDRVIRTGRSANSEDKEAMESLGKANKKLSASEEKKLDYEGLSEEWSNRLSDYKFLSGEQPLRRRHSVFSRARNLSKRTRRHSVTGSSRRNKNEPGYQCARCRMVVHKSCMSNVNMCHGCVPQLPLQQQGHQPPSLYPGYGNLQVQEYPWWAERMSRDDATIHLGLSTNGTFLIRWSDRHEKLILSLKAMGEVKHMRILRQEEGGYFYLSEARYFKDIMELINFYRQSPLSESFTGLDCCLRRPLYDSAVVKFPYVGTGASHLSLVPGQKIVIMSREGENRGWWKGRSGNRMGYFPKEYVTLEHNSMHPW